MDDVQQAFECAVCSLLPVALSDMHVAMGMNAAYYVQVHAVAAAH